MSISALLVRLQGEPTSEEDAMSGKSKIAVAGATGRVGRHVVDVLTERGQEVVPISRAAGVDVISAEGLAEALSGAEAVVDVATGPSPDEAEATEFFTTAARNLQEVGAAAGVKRLVVVSIIGVGHYNGGYGKAKLVHERASQAGPVPARILRAAQFHEFVPVLFEWGRRGDVVEVPEMRTQIVAARSVAEELADLALDDSEPKNASIPEVAGPREERLVELARLYAERTGERVRVEEVRDPVDHEINTDGTMLPGPGATLAGPTFAEWLDAKVAATLSSA
jgi:uncharacterized protein YbjT (DUF2867 family)